MYLNNPRLRGIDDGETEYEDWQIEEIRKIVRDPIYFILHYIKIVDGDLGLINFQPREYALKFIKAIHENSYLIAKFPRQSGKSITVAAYMVWYVLFNPNKSALILAHKKSMSSEQLRRIKAMIIELPLWLQVPVLKWNQGSIEFANGSRMECSATKEDSGRGFTNNFLYLDEFAFVEPYIANEFISSVIPTVSSMTTAKVIITSCVVKNTWIFTNNGLKQISNFIDDNRPDGYGYYVPEYKVQGFNKDLNTGIVMHNDGEKETKQISSIHSFIESSLEHKYYACKNGVYGIFRAKELEVGDYISIKYGMNIWGNNDNINQSELNLTGSNLFNMNHITKDFAYFLGLYIAEGYSRKEIGTHASYSTVISCGDDVSDCLNTLSLRYRKVDKFHYVISSKSLITILEYLGFNINQKAKNKIIPSKLLEMSRDNIIAMLQGLFDGDGTAHKTKARISIGFASKELTIQVRMLLLNLGILTSWSEGITPPTKLVKVSSNYYKIDANNSFALKFYNIVGFRFNRKQARISNCITTKHIGSNADVIPYSNNIIKQLGIKEISHIGIHRDLKHFSREKMLGIKKSLIINNNEYNKFMENVQEDLIWDKITNIDSGVERVYDFSLNDNENDKWAHSVVYGGILGFQTPRGLNHFWKMWTDAENKAKSGLPMDSKDFRTIEIAWNEVPGRTEEWKKTEIDKIGIVRFKQEYECEFQGSVATLIDAGFLKKLPVASPIAILEDDRLRIFKYPMNYQEYKDKGYEYIVTVDPAMGTKQDYSVSQVWLVKSNTDIEQVAVYESNDIIPKNYIEKIYYLAKIYYDAGIIVETMEQAGGAIITGLHYDKNYPNLIHMNEHGLGFNLSHNRKMEACIYLQVYIERGLLKICDINTITELCTFGKKGNSYAALGDAHDDLVTAILSVLYYANSPYYYGNIDDEPIYKKRLITNELSGLDKITDPTMREIVNKLTQSPDELEQNTPIIFRGKSDYSLINRENFETIAYS